MRFDLEVSFQEKDQAKRYGARWDGGARVWFYEGEELPAGLRRWYREPLQPIQEADGDDPYAKYKSVTEIGMIIGQNLRVAPELQNVLVKGEVADYNGKPYHGHYYFNIKDSVNRIKCHIHANNARVLQFALENGKQVAIQGYVDVSMKSTQCSIEVRVIHDIGDGAAKLALAKLDKELRDKGYYDPEHKQPIPMYPTKIGIVSTQDGAGFGDMLKKAADLDPTVQIYLYDSRVQGSTAANTIAMGIQVLDTMGLDFIIVGRGGGATDDFHAFNELIVLDAVFAATTPIISAVGHTRDLTLIDKVADDHCITPTDAVVSHFRNRSDERKNLQRQTELLHHFFRIALEKRKELLAGQRDLLNSLNPIVLLNQKKQELEKQQQALDFNIKRAYNQRVALYKECVAALHGLAPTAKLINGFGYITSENQPVRSVEELHVQDELEIIISDGTIRAQVTGVEKSEKL